MGQNPAHIAKADCREMEACSCQEERTVILMDLQESLPQFSMSRQIDLVTNFFCIHLLLWGDLSVMQFSLLQFCRHVQFSSVAQSCVTLCDPMDYSTPGLPIHHQLLDFTQTHVHWVGDAIQPPHLLSSSSALSLSQNQSLFQWVISLHQVAKVLEFQLQHHSFQWIFSTDFL